MCFVAESSSHYKIILLRKVIKSGSPNYSYIDKIYANRHIFMVIYCIVDIIIYGYLI